MNNSNFKIKTLLISFVFLTFINSTSFAAETESCDCTIDTLGYSNFVSTLTIADVPIQFHVQGTFAVAIGYITTNTPSVVQNLIDNNPSVTTIVFLDSGGSEDDSANLNASQLIRDAGYKMYIPSNGLIASGAVDMFFAGTRRVVDLGAQIGVHSWSDGTNDATFYPVGHPYHQPYIDYYISMGLSQQESEDFYYFTINAAPAAGIHWMSNTEIDTYKVRTCSYSNSPTYATTTSGATITANLSGASYQWIDCSTNTDIPGETNQSFTPTSNGQYAVTITETNCSGTSPCETINTVSQSELQHLQTIHAYPNPARHTITLLNTRETDIIHLYNSQGTFITEYTSSLSIKKLSSGVYFFKIQRANSSHWVRWIKE